MKKLLMLAALAAPGCASIVSHHEWPVDVTSEPTGATYRIKNMAGDVIHVGKTPETVKLTPSRGYMKGETYQFCFDGLDGQPPLERPLAARINGWYWGNFALGGLFGMLVLDPLTGHMWKVDGAVHGDLRAVKFDAPAVKTGTQ